MCKRAIICLCLVILFPAGTYAKRYLGTHFIIESNVDSRLAENVQKKADAFYTGLTKNYSLTGWMFPLTVYYSQDESQTNRLLSKYGFAYIKGNSYYNTGSPAIYIHQLDEDGQKSDTGLLFYGITRHFIQHNFKNPPEWFREGLCCFFAKQAVIVNDKLLISGSPLDNEQALKEKIDKGQRLIVKTQLFNMTAEQFKSLPYGCHFVREFFYWLYDTNYLAAYLSNAKKDGFNFSVLEKTVPSGERVKINKSFMEFLEKTCYAEAHFSEALRIDDPNKRKETLVKTLELKKDYHKAQLELTKHYHKAKDIQKCKESLEQILNFTNSPEYITANVLMGNLYYEEKDYSKAVEYYTKAWDDSKNYDYSYRIAYRLANGYNHLKDTSSAKKWYQTFLKNKWDSDDMKTCEDYAQKYVEYSLRIENTKSTRRRNPFARPQPKS
jgi:tetratricopeptide (TPR) repeat protein